MLTSKDGSFILSAQNKKLLRERGFRLTEQRRAIIDVIAAQDGHLTAEEIYEQAHRLNPQISLATVYRTLGVLKEIGVIEQHFVSPGHERAHFEAAHPEPPTTSGHSHFHCTRCGRVIEFHSSESVSTALQILEADSGVGKISQICMCVQGLCADCASEGKPE